MAAHPEAARRRGLLLLAAVVAVLGLVPIDGAGAAATAPAGYRLVAAETLGPGVEHRTLRREQPPTDVHVARLAPGMAGRLLPVLGNDVLSGPSAGRETTTSMCVRVRCVAAVNGDFFDGAGRPIGAMVSAGELLTTPGPEHILLRVDSRGRPTLRPGIDWRVAVATADGQVVAAQAVNRPLAGDGVALYTGRWGPTTPADPAATEVSLRLPPSAGILPSGSSPVRVGAARAGGGVPIAGGHVVLSGRGAGAGAVANLARWASSGAVLHVDVGGIVTALGGSPQLLHDGAPAFPAEVSDDFTRGRHPRTMVGVTPAGELLLVTADGRGASAGLSLAEAATLLRGLGAVDALNLDGGGSTTFVAGGSVRNVPSDGRERPVAAALTVMAGGPPDPLTSLLTQVTDDLAAVLQPPR
ncbi:MAG TPA: phosphodiester glycosidase family protein [Acidimicrobiales bacterium]|nr:phosphodiester glycosidase family protein [Acidimicrobiales bacterium]